MNKCIDLLHKLIKKRKKIEEKIYANKSIILKLAKKIQEEYKDFIYIISSEKILQKYFDFKTNDDDIGFCGTLELVINDESFIIDRIGFLSQHKISFYKNDIFINGYNSLSKKSLSKINCLSVTETVKIIKTLNYMLENKQMIFKSLEEYISKILDDKITKCSKEVNILEEKLNFIENIKL